MRLATINIKGDSGKCTTTAGLVLDVGVGTTASSMHPAKENPLRERFPRTSGTTASSSMHRATDSSSNIGVDSKNTTAEMDGGSGCLDRVESEREELERLRVEWAQQVSGMLASRVLG